MRANKLKAIFGIQAANIVGTPKFIALTAVILEIKTKMNPIITA